MPRWRSWAVAAGSLLSVCGLCLWAWGGGPLLLIGGVIAMATVLLEPAYGTVMRRPSGPNWRATDEKFVDPETGLTVTVWYDPATGARRYVSEERPTGAA